MNCPRCSLHSEMHYEPDTGIGPVWYCPNCGHGVKASATPAGHVHVSGDAPEKPKGTSIPCPTEHEEQVALFAWSDTMMPHYPELRLLHAIPNAGAGAQSGRAGWLKAEGVKPGVPDLFLPVARSGKHGLYVELKRVRGGHLSDEQAQWAIWLTNEGYLVVTRKGWQAASEAIIGYLEDRDE